MTALLLENNKWKKKYEFKPFNMHVNKIKVKLNLQHFKSIKLTDLRRTPIKWI